jgi:hypothetical protein
MFKYLSWNKLSSWNLPGVQVVTSRWGNTDFPSWDFLLHSRTPAEAYIKCVGLDLRYFGLYYQSDRPCGLVITISGFRPRSSGFDFRRCQSLWVAVGLTRGPLNLMRMNEELLEGKAAASLYKTAVGVRHSDHATPLYLQKLALKFGHSFGIVHLRTKKKRNLFLVCFYW